MSRKTEEYYLPKHVFLCVVEGIVIFLDLHHDSYVSPEPDKMKAVLSILSIYPEPPFVSKTNGIKQNSESLGEKYNRDDITENIVEDLISKKILTTDALVGKEITPVTIEIPPLDLSGYEFGKTAKIKAGHIIKFFTATALTYLKLRFTSTEKIVNSVKDRKRKHQSTPSSKPEEIRELVEIFKILRPLFFTAKDHCLFDSLALIEFMARSSIYPTWVFGVKIGPFGAHCWVQDDNFIYNESLQNAHHFTPIMTV